MMDYPIDRIGNTAADDMLDQVLRSRDHIVYTLIDNLVVGCDSIRSYSSAGEHLLHRQGVVGSKPSNSTSRIIGSIRIYRSPKRKTAPDRGGFLVSWSYERNTTPRAISRKTTQMTIDNGGLNPTRARSLDT